MFILEIKRIRENIKSCTIKRLSELEPDGKNPESNDTQQMSCNNQYLYVPVNRKIGITEKFINIFLCIEKFKIFRLLL